jgi:hypothetical protein
MMGTGDNVEKFRREAGHSSVLLHLGNILIQKQYIFIDYSIGYILSRPVHKGGSCRLRRSPFSGKFLDDLAKNWIF